MRRENAPPPEKLASGSRASVAARAPGKRVCKLRICVGLLRCGEKNCVGCAQADLGTLSGGGNSFATGINNAGTIVGRAYSSAGPQHAFSYSNGVMTDLGTAVGIPSYAYGINTTGTIVGTGGTSGVFSYSNGINTALGYLGWASANPTGINDAGTIVGSGYTTNSANYLHAFSYSNGTTTDLGTTPGWTNSDATAINATGTVVGYAYNTSGHILAFSYSNGTATYLGSLGDGSYSEAWGINTAGMIVGSTVTNTGYDDAFIYSSTQMVDLNSLVSLPGVTLTVAYAINDLGQIAAADAFGHTYLLTLAAVPEPSADAAIFGMVVLGFAAYKRRRSVAVG